VMGMGNSIQWFAWGLQTFLLNLVSSVIICSLLKVGCTEFVGGYPMLSGSVMGFSTAI